jgi:hypothetical protein
MGSNNLGKQVSFQKVVTGPRVSVSSQYKKITVACPPGPNCQQMQYGFTNHCRQ